MDSAAQADRIAKHGKDLDYEQEALAGLKRAGTLESAECRALAEADAEVWAILQLARATGHQDSAATDADSDSDYEQRALDLIRDSWTAPTRPDQAAALRKAKVWATLYLAQITAEQPTRRRRITRGAKITTRVNHIR